MRRRPLGAAESVGLSCGSGAAWAGGGVCGRINPGAAGLAGAVFLFMIIRGTAGAEVGFGRAVVIGAIGLTAGRAAAAFGATPPGDIFVGRGFGAGVVVAGLGEIAEVAATGFAAVLGIITGWLVFLP